MAQALEKPPVLANAGSRFDYILDRIEGADFRAEPFRHIYLGDLFEADDFAAITAAPEIDFGPQASDEAMFETLFGAGYKIIEFPGCITDRAEYLNWHKDRSRRKVMHSACEGFGMTLRLMRPTSPIVAELMEFLNGEAFQTTLARKFGFDSGELVYDAGIQKYLDGYEISPHPDIRKKALTYMVNVNPSADSESRDHHTHYMRFKSEHAYVQSFWTGNVDKDRCWVPWDWCETVDRQPVNNSMVIFAPSNDTLHAIKASYDHLDYQRTQLYGNFWHPVSLTTSTPAWEDLVISESAAEKPLSRKRLAGMLPPGVKAAVKRTLQARKRNENTEDRFYKK